MPDKPITHGVYECALVRLISRQKKAAGRYREAGVKNVTTEVVHTIPNTRDIHTSAVELLNGGGRNTVRRGDLSISLSPGSPGRNGGDGKSAVDVNYHNEAGKTSVKDVINDAGSDTEHETAHRYLYGDDNQPPGGVMGHSTDPNSPMQMGEEVIDKPFTPNEAEVLKEKLNKPNEVQKP